MRILGGATLGLLSLPVLYLGLEFLWLGLGTHIGHPFYVPYSYFSQGGIWLVWGLLILGLGLLPLFRRKSTALSFALAVILLFLAALAIPSNRTPAQVSARAQEGVRAALRRTNTALSVGAKDAGLFPSSQSALEELVGNPGPASWGEKSFYARDSQRLPYRIIHTAEAPGPRISPVEGDPPGTIYCAVSPDLKKVWITGTVLDKAVAGEVTMLLSPDGSGPQIEQHQIDQPDDSQLREKGARPAGQIQ